MRTVILAGGLGTRLSEETDVKPKPMVEIGGRPILWHILKHYSRFGFREFLIALGYKGEVIKRFFMEDSGLLGSLSIDMTQGKITKHEQTGDDWLIHLMDTGLATNTGGRLKRLQPWLKDATFFLTYGDGLSDVDLHKLLAFHRRHGKLATVTAVRPPARFGGLAFEGDLVAKFTEKPQIGEGWINGGFFAFEPGVFDYLQGDETSLEADALENLAADRQLMAYRHDRFWQCMDNLRDKRLLETLWQEGRAPWMARQ
jgi:glucose-1-phosphate cytidylyltransferase